jgi:3-deoxy-D-manno-octulosonic-acid transferase
MALAAFRELSQKHPRLRLVLVPRHPDRFEAVARLLDSSGIAWQRRTSLGARDEGRGASGESELESESAPSSPAPRVLLVDVVGELGAWWGTARIAFVGGSMGSRGGQNMIEPAAYGAAVSFGPHTWNFRDIVAAMLDHNAAVVVDNDAQFREFVRRCLEESEYAAALGQRARSFVQSQLGATQRTLRLLEGVKGVNV